MYKGMQKTLRIMKMPFSLHPWPYTDGPLWSGQRLVIFTGIAEYSYMERKAKPIVANPKQNNGDNAKNMS